MTESTANPTRPAPPTADEAGGLMRWALAPVDAERAADLAPRLGQFRAVLQLLDRFYSRDTEPIGLRVPDQPAPGEAGR